jgi:hypothetical protein
MLARTSQRCCNKSRVNGLSPYSILAAGLGVTLRSFGHVAIGLEGAAQFAAMARAYSGCGVWQQDFLKLDLPENYFNGVFANASLFHVPSQELSRVLLELRACLNVRFLFGSIARGLHYVWLRHRAGSGGKGARLQLVRAFRAQTCGS